MKDRRRKPVRQFALERFVIAAAKFIHRTQEPGKHVVSREDADEKVTSYRSKFVTIDGFRIHYRDEGKGFPLVLVHGFAASLQVWDGWTGALKKKYRIIRLDSPGFALSGPLPSSQEVSPEFFAEMLSKFLDHLGIEQCHLGGNSLGGWISWEFARKYSQRVKKLILVNSAGYLTEETRPGNVDLLTRDELRNLVRTGVPRAVIKLMVRQSFGDRRRAPKEMVDRQYILTNREGNLSTLMRIAGTDIYPDPERIKSVPQPTLIMWGTHDRVIDVRDAHRFHNDLPQSKLIIYDKIGHIPMVEIPEKTAADLLAFLEGKSDVEGAVSLS